MPSIPFGFLFIIIIYLLLYKNKTRGIEGYPSTKTSLYLSSRPEPSKPYSSIRYFLRSHQTVLYYGTMNLVNLLRQLGFSEEKIKNHIEEWPTNGRIVKCQNPDCKLSFVENRHKRFCSTKCERRAYYLYQKERRANALTNI